MRHILLNWLLSAVAIVIVANIIPGIELAGFGSALIAAIVIGLVSATLGLVLKILTFPFAILTLGLIWLIVNAFMLLVASAFSPGFRVNGFWPAFWGSIVLSLVQLVLRSLFNT